MSKAYRPIDDFEKVVNKPGWWVVMEGDWGGTILATVPAKDIKTPERAMEMAKYLNAIVWPCNEGEGVSIHLQRGHPGDSVWGGMGGGVLMPKVWLHDQLRSCVAIDDAVNGWLCEGRRVEQATA